MELTLNGNIAKIKIDTLKQPLNESINSYNLLDVKSLILKEINDNNLSVIDYDFMDTFDGEEVDVEVRHKTPQELEEELFEEMDNQVNPNTFGMTRLAKDADPKKIDVIMKNTFAAKLADYTLKSDVGNWEVKQVKNTDGKLEVVWYSKDQEQITLSSVFFTKESNKIKNTIMDRGTPLYTDYFEIYRIPLDYPTALKLFKKSYFPLLKNFINTIVIRLRPFNRQFVFWHTNNPNFSYSFSSPKKNKVLLGLINFISTTQRPILDDFFEQNNLRHKQGYLQNLLDAAEAAGIFEFKRTGNEILIVRGINYQTFLDGKLRRIQT